MPYIIYALFLSAIALAGAAICYEQKEARQYRAWVRAQRNKPKP